MPRKPKGDPLLGELKDAIRKVLKDPNATPTERLRAIDAASKLLLIEHKITGEADDGGHFFGR